MPILRTALPVIRWTFDTTVDISGIATFVIACAGPLGVLTGAMVTGKFADAKNGKEKTT